MDTGAQNESWAKELIDSLIAQGVDYFCCAPGSRSTPLVLAIASHPQNLHIVHFDERGTCFHALGYAKARGKPAAIITTSGTAVGNLLPGIMEAYNENIPLILLTADRPPELRDCGANQTCDQNKLFTNHVRWQVDLPCPDDRIPKNYLPSTIAHAVALSTSSTSGPVHINCMFREPLFSGPIPSSAKKQIHFTHPELHPSKQTIDEWVEILASQRNGVIIAGSSTIDHSEEILALAERLKWPIFADILSSVRTYESHPSLITHFDPILKCRDKSADAIIQIGDRFVSKTLSQWLEKQEPAFHLHISEHPTRQDPSHLITHRAHACPKVFVRKLLHALAFQENDKWRAEWSHWDQSCRLTLTHFFSSETELTEPGLIPQIASLLTEDWALFLSNSMPIRDANQFFRPLSRCGPIFGNRGVSGIDGNIATAAGIAQGTRKPTLAILGDLAFLHDLNSLAYLNKIDFPLVLFVVNNGGGGIFSFLPISKKEESFETFFAGAHEITFEPAARLFGIPHYHPKSPSDLNELLLSQKKNSHSCIIEITTDRIQNVRIHEQINAAIRTCLANSLAEIPATLH